MPVIGSEFVYEIRDFQNFGGQQVLNVWNYRQTSGSEPVAAVDVANAFDQQKLDSIVTIQNIQVTHTLLEVQQLGSLTNFAQYDPTHSSGEMTGTSMATFMAYRFDLLRTTKETRRGYKRIVGLTEEVAEGSSYIAAFITSAGVVATELADSLNIVGLIDLVPVIVGGKYDTTVSPPVLKDPADWLYNPVADVVFNPLITTQNSRKIGRGV